MKNRESVLAAGCLTLAAVLAEVALFYRRSTGAPGFDILVEGLPLSGAMSECEG